MKTIVKAITGAITAFGTGLITAASNGGIDSNEWYVIIGGTLIAGAAVYSLPNAVQNPPG